MPYNTKHHMAKPLQLRLLHIVNAEKSPALPASLSNKITALLDKSTSKKFVGFMLFNFSR